MPAPDRLEQLRAQSAVTGIDFVYVYLNQTTLDVYFLRSPTTLDPPPLIDAGTLTPDLIPAQIRIYSPSGGEHLPEVTIDRLEAAIVDSRPVLRIFTTTPGDFSRYRLIIDDPRIDPYYNDVGFSFKAHCRNDLDCKPPPHECPPEAWVDFPVDYLARDFWSFRQALLDFAAQRYPDWQDRLEADIGIMLAEVLSALGDELAYAQDRVGREGYLETTSQRRSLRQHARLVDYTIHDGLAAATWLVVTVSNDSLLPAGLDVWAESDRGDRINYEVGQGLTEVLAGKTYAATVNRNELQPHLWDEDDVCLAVGTTELFVQGHHAADFLPFNDLERDPPGTWVLLQTHPTDAAIAQRRWLVRLIAVEDTRDPVFNANITRLQWEEAQALPFELDLTVLTVWGNVLPVTAGKTFVRRFQIGATDDWSDRPEAIEREGPNGTVAYRFSLPGADGVPLVWLGDDPREARPEIHLAEVQWDGLNWNETTVWEWRRSLLGVNSSQFFESHFTLEDGTWRRVVGYQRSGQEIIHRDYASNLGWTVRFGDGEWGRIPPEGSTFQVTYRLGNGRRSNVPADSLIHLENSPSVVAVTNPLAATQGTDAESAAAVRQLAPDAFRAITYRAVRPEDYAEAAERLPWVQRAGGVFYWTGSWLTAFVTPDPRGSTVVTAEQQTELHRQLDRFRQAGREAYSLAPRYANLDLEIHICVEPTAYPGDVEARVLAALLGVRGVRPRSGFFSPDQFTFGTPLHRSALEAVIQAVPGVRAVEQICIRRRGWFDWQVFSDLVYEVAANEVIRLENDPQVPERGSLKILTEGGA